MIRRMISTMVAGLTGLYCSIASAEAIPTSDAMRDVRYCEILTVSGGSIRPVVSVYNTYPMNLCPNEKWNSLNADEVAKSLGVRAVVLNGPRHFVFDAISGSGATASGERIEVEAISMIKRAEVQLSLQQLTSEPYSERVIERETEYLFKAGKPIFLLLTPNNVAYVMQSYSLQVDPTLSYSELHHIESTLSLPTGWSFRTRVPDVDFRAAAAGEAVIVRDDLANTYQRLSVLPAFRAP